MAGEGENDNGDGGSKKPRTEAEKRRRTEQRRNRRARKANLRREQSQMLRQLGGGGPTECRFCYASTHDSADCVDKEAIQARNKRKLDRRLQMKEAREEKAAAEVEEVQMQDNIRLLFADKLPDGAPLTSSSLNELYRQFCLRSLKNTLPEEERNDWNTRINNAVRQAMGAGDNTMSAYLGRLVVEA